MGTYVYIYICGYIDIYTVLCFFFFLCVCKYPPITAWIGVSRYCVCVCVCIWTYESMRKRKRERAPPPPLPAWRPHADGKKKKEREIGVDRLENNSSFHVEAYLRSSIYAQHASKKKKNMAYWGHGSLPFNSYHWKRSLWLPICLRWKNHWKRKEITTSYLRQKWSSVKKERGGAGGVTMVTLCSGTTDSEEEEEQEGGGEGIFLLHWLYTLAVCCFNDVCLVSPRRRDEGVFVFFWYLRQLSSLISRCSPFLPLSLSPPPSLTSSFRAYLYMFFFMSYVWMLS